MGKKVLIAGYPRCGNSWLGYMLSYILGAKYIDLQAPDSKATHQKEILQLIEGNLPHKSDYETVCKTHKRYNFSSDDLNLESYDKVIHIVRDPRDVSVSYYFYTYYNVPIAQGKPENILSRKSWVTRKYCWKKMVYKVAREWPLHTMSWRTFEGARLFRYEDLYKDCPSTLKNICDYLEVHCDKNLINETIQRFAFDKVSGGRKVGKEYPAGFFRKGIIGDFHNHFGWMDTLIMKHYAATEMFDLGYEK